MASARTDEFISDEDWGQTLFSRQYCAEIFKKIVGIYDVIQEFIDANTTTESEKKSLKEKKVADQKFSCLMDIITKNCNNNNLQVFKSFIDVLKSKNENVANHLSVIYNDRAKFVDSQNQLHKEKTAVRNLEGEVDCLKKQLKETEFLLETSKQERDKLIDLANDKEKDRKGREKIGIEIKLQDEYILKVENEREQLIARIKELETEIERKTNVISKLDAEIKQKDRSLKEAIKESDRLRIEVDELKTKYNLAVGKEKDKLSKNIESLEDRLKEKENTIIELRKNQTMTKAQVGEEFSNITKHQDEKFEEQNQKFKEQNQKLEEQNKKLEEQNQKIDAMSAALAKLASLMEKKE